MGEDSIGEGEGDSGRDGSGDDGMILISLPTASLPPSSPFDHKIVVTFEETHCRLKRRSMIIAYQIIAYDNSISDQLRRKKNGSCATVSWWA